MITKKQLYIILFIAVLLAAGFVVSKIKKPEVNLSTSQAAGNLLSISDLTCVGMFTTPAGVSDAGRAAGALMAMRYEADGKRHYFVYGGDGRVSEFPEPTTLSPCNTSINSAVRATFEPWGGKWGEFVVNSGDNYIPGQNMAFAFGLYYDNALSQLVLSWTNTYVTGGQHNSFAAATLDENDRRLNTVGCWAIEGLAMPQAGSGVLDIPSSFVSANLSAGARWGVGFGGYIASVQSGASYGPALTAVVPPPENACAPNTDYYVSGTRMSYFRPNRNGPTCTGPNGRLGCTPTQAPTIPYPAKIAMITYSKIMYGEDWDPWGGTGWYGFGASHSMGWYDDGVKQGIVVPMIVPEGWANTIVLANPAPSVDLRDQYNSIGTMYVASTSTNDGLNMKPGDGMWVKTCRVGIDPGCDSTANGRDFSIIKVTAVDPATGRVDFRFTNSDFGSGDHKPIVGGPVYHGCVYMHGTPFCSRRVLRLQIYDPVQYAEVIRGTRQLYNVTYAEDTDLSSLVPNFGAPMSVMTDPGARQIIMASKGGGALYSHSNAVYVFDVSGGAPSPAPTLSFSATSVSISPGASTTLNWSSANATSCIASGAWSGSKPTAGSQTVTPAATSTYTLACTGNGRTVTSSVTISVGALAPEPPTPPPPPPGPPPPVYPVLAGNVASSTNGATAVVSSTHSGGYSASGAINNDRKGLQWGTSGGWNDGTSNTFPDWLEVDFSASKNLGEVDVFSVQDNYTNPVDPTSTMTFASYGIKNFEVQYWTGSAWTAIPGATVTNNNLVWRKLTFPPIITSKIRVYITQTLDQWSRITEVEAYETTSPTPTPIVGDLNNDGIVNTIDWSIMNAKWFTNDATADLNRDGIVNSIDFSILNRNWLKTTP